MANINSSLKEIDLTKLDKKGFDSIKAGLNNDFPDREQGVTKYSSGDYWFIQLKTSWDNYAIIHYEVIYDAVENEGEYADEGVRVELHFEWKGKKKVNGLYEYLKQWTAIFGLSWKEWAPYRCIIADKIGTYQGIVDGFHRAIEIFDNLITQYIMIEHYIELLEGNSNLVLTGAPGTGKTYLAKQIASKMILGKEYDPKKMKEEDCEERKIFDEHCEFVQFHPSYDYTDFVEGLRPTKPDEKGNIGFERQNGVFKKFCAKALKELRIDVTDNFGEAWKNLLATIAEKGQIEVRLLSGNREMEIRLNEEGDGIIEYQEGKNIDSNSLFTFDKLYNIYKGGKGTPSGAHDTYRRAVIKEMIRGYGLKEYNPGKIKKYDIKEDKPFIMIIDEINRGDISKIFGELFFSIDPGYRGKDGRVQTQYQNMIDKDGNDEFKDGFYVPENVYIIGTMNDIDRSVESMDFAMRRRFTWQEITAEATQYMLDDLSDSKKVKHPLDSKDVEIVKIRMKNLNDEIENEEIGLNSAYHIGAAYFMKLANYDGDPKARFEKLWKNHLEGVLKEYLRGADDVDDKIRKLRDAFDKKG